MFCSIILTDFNLGVSTVINAQGYYITSIISRRFDNIGPVPYRLVGICLSSNKELHKSCIPNVLLLTSPDRAKRFPSVGHLIRLIVILQ